MNCIVPIAMKAPPVNDEGLHYCTRNFDPFFISACVELGSNFQSRSRGGRADQADDRLVALEWFASPIHRDEREESVLDLVPLTRAWWHVADVDRQLRVVCEALKLTLPKRVARAVATPRIGDDQKLLCVTVCFAPHRLPPRAN